MPDYLMCFSAFSKAYLEGVSWESAGDLEIRVTSLLPALLLARVDGKSPVEYITVEQDKALVRDVARPLILRPPLRLNELALRWRDALVARFSQR